MEDIADKLSALLNSPDGMDRIKAAAQSILGGSDGDTASGGGKSSDNAPAASGLANFSLPAGLMENAGNIEGILRIMNLLQSRQEDSRVQLLLALKPHLSKERARRVDQAISLLRVASLLPVLKEEGLLDSLGLGFGE